MAQLWGANLLCFAGHEAGQLEASLGLAVIRHSEKKPGGGGAEVAAHFGCQPHELVMVGDRWALGGGLGDG